MPALGADMTEGMLVEWLVDEKEEVRRGDIVAEVETEKGIIEIEIFEDGMFEKFLVQPGETVAVGTVLAVIRPSNQKSEVDGNTTSEALPSGTPPGKKPPTYKACNLETHRKAQTSRHGETPEDRPDFQGKRRKISPLARKKAEEWGGDSDTVEGTGPDGVISAADIEKARQRNIPAEKTWPQGKEPRKKEPSQAAMRQAIARATALSNREIPHYYLQTRIDMKQALEWLSKQNQQRPVKERILPAVLGLKALAQAAHKVPELNGFWMNERHQPSTTIHIGVAISLRGGGLIAPAIHNVDTLGLDELMRSLHDLITRTRSGRLRGSELTDATITLTNLGDRGVETVYGIIYPPQLALVGFGKILEQPWAENGMLTVRPVLCATLAADHRATDGHTGALFLEALKHALQEPENL